MSKANPKCIVCGRPIRKHVEVVDVRPVSFTAGSDPTARVNADLHTKDDCLRHTNAPFVTHIVRGPHGLVLRFHTWDGESFENMFFCTGYCAQRQGYASAQHGHRFTWNTRDDQ